MRFEDELRWQALVHCPSCDGRAVVFWFLNEHATSNDLDGMYELRLSCGNCGHSQSHPRRLNSEWQTIAPERYSDGEPPFGARLWLRTDCCGNTLWAVNAQHLDYIAAYVAETQRDREFSSSPFPGSWTWRDRGLAWKLPKWMKLAKNREEVLRAVERLRATL